MIIRSNQYPDIYLVGAPKCGTTSIQSCISRSGNVSFLKKETHFFGQDLCFNRPRCNRSDYVKRVQALRDKSSLVGDASVMYLYSKKAASEIFSANPNAKIIICLREPIAFMQSLHQQLLSTVDQNIKDFELALNFGDYRHLNNKIPWYTHPKDALNYRAMANFAPQVKRYIELFGKQNVKVILFEEFQQNNLKVIQEVYSFLQLGKFEETIRADHKNPTTASKYPTLRIIYKSILSEESTLRRLLPEKMTKLIDSAAGRYLYEPASKAVISSKLKISLQLEFQDKIEDLEALLGTKLDSWRH